MINKNIVQEMGGHADELIKEGNISLTTTHFCKHKGKEIIVNYKITNLEASRKLEAKKFDKERNNKKSNLGYFMFGMFIFIFYIGINAGLSLWAGMGYIPWSVVFGDWGLIFLAPIVSLFIIQIIDMWLKW